jgi:hypothetical protein
MSAIPLPEDRLGAFVPGNDALLFRAALAPG